MHPDDPDEATIRGALVERAKEFSRRTGVPLSGIGKAAVNDSSFILDVARGANFTVGRYQRAQEWLDKHWPDTKQKSEPARCVHMPVQGDPPPAVDGSTIAAIAGRIAARQEVYRGALEADLSLLRAKHGAPAIEAALKLIDSH